MEKLYEDIPLVGYRIINSIIKRFAKKVIVIQTKEGMKLLFTQHIDYF